jgi:hypothetical protein
VERKKVVSDKKMEKVDIRAFGKMNYVYLYLNEKRVKIEEHEDSKPYDAFEYDYNEFVVEETNVDLNDIRANPEKYLDYVPTTNVSFEETQTDFNIDIDYRVSMLELGLI